MLPKEFGIAPNYYLTIIIAAIIIEDENQGEEEVAIPYLEEEEQKVETEEEEENNYGVRLITLVIRLLRATMVSIPGNLKWVFWIGLFRPHRELEKDEYWGYITNCGIEGNLHGILVGRVFPDGILYASRDTHYSVFKAARMYWTDCVKVNTLVSGEIGYADFKDKLQMNKEKPAIINVNIGTTVKGAVDDLDLVIKTLEETGFSHD
ncbi:hypothetical protein IFM89_019362 [Coptis chinensis]|uniref:Uncharacterized protein n=1 Tax=Coptis chinensis TaxID=261450 RepID=A0A835MA39_9MAGN|nr:hypothetical protein IFM89_019362 [Coptis chinensis]